MATSNEPDFFQLNKHRLDEEWVEQPHLYHEHALALADARQDYERAKTDLEVTLAEADQSVRANPGAYGIDGRVTEGAIDRTVTTLPTVRKAQERTITTKHAMDVAQAAVSALDHRKAALENLVRLQLADYYSSPREPAGAGKRLADAKVDAAFGPRRKP